MKTNSLYEEYHSKDSLQKKIISKNNFTYRNILEKTEPYVPLSRNVLDVGSATGTVSFYFGAMGMDVDGIELSKNAVLVANKNKQLLGLKKVHFYRTPIEKHNTAKRYDLVLCFEVLEHLQDDLFTLKKIAKLMKVNSHLILTVPSANAPLHRLGLLRKFDRNVGHLRRYTIVSLMNIIKRSGLIVERKYKTEGLFRSILFTNKIVNMLVKLTRFKFINDLFTYIDRCLLVLFSESQLIFVCKRR